MAETPHDKRDDKEFAEYKRIKAQMEEEKLDAAVKEFIS